MILMCPSQLRISYDSMILRSPKSRSKAPSPRLPPDPPSVPQRSARVAPGHPALWPPGLLAALLQAASSELQGARQHSPHQHWGAPVHFVSPGKEKCSLHLTVTEAVPARQAPFVAVPVWLPSHYTGRERQLPWAPDCLAGNQVIFALFYPALFLNILPRAKGLESPPLGSPTARSSMPGARA